MTDVKSKKPSGPLKDLLLLFSIPITIAILAVAVTYFPKVLANPSYDFIFEACDDYRCKNRFMVNSSGQVVEDMTDPLKVNYLYSTANLYYYDSTNDSTRRLTLDEVNQYGLNTSSKSPDGYVLKNESTNSGFLFWSEYDNGWYLKNGAKKKEIELTTGNSYYSREIKFLGWVNK